MLVSLVPIFRTVLAVAPYPVGVAWARWLADNALARRLFFARDIRLMRNVYENTCGIRLDDRAVQRILAAKTLNWWRLFKVRKFSDREMERYVRINGLDNIQELSGSGQGVVLASAHYFDLGCIPTILARLGFDFRSLRRSRPRRDTSHSISRFIYVGGDNAFPAFQEISGVLKGGGMIHSLFDGMQGRGTVARPFLGRVCRFRRSLIELAWTEDAAIVPVSVRSDLEGRIVIDIHEPISTEEDRELPMKAAVAGIVGRYASFLENTIRTDPWCFDPARLELFFRRTSVDEADSADSAAAS